MADNAADENRDAQIVSQLSRVINQWSQLLTTLIQQATHDRQSVAATFFLFMFPRPDDITVHMSHLRAQLSVLSSLIQDGALSPAFVAMSQEQRIAHLETMIAQVRAPVANAHSSNQSSLCSIL